jgi:hypothetical protein
MKHLFTIRIQITYSNILIWTWIFIVCTVFSVDLKGQWFYTTGVAGGDAINIKSGVLADVAFNVIYSPNTNALKLSNSGDRTPQAYIVGYNNTIINAGWRRPTTKGGSIWLEKQCMQICIIIF